MRRDRVVSALMLALLLCLTVPMHAAGVTLYVNRLFVAETGAVRLGDLVHAEGALAPQARETLALGIASLSGRVLYIPASAYRGMLEDGFGPDPIIVGAHSLVVPRGLFPDAAIPALDRIVDFLSRKELLGNEKVELEIAAGLPLEMMARAEDLSFRLMKSSSTGAEISYKISGPSMQSRSGRMAVRFSPDAPVEREGVKTNEQVKVLFRKGPISIEVPGRALASASVGEPVTVYVAESARSFSGRLVSGKAVEIELP